MGIGYTCDMTGKVMAGDGLKHLDVRVSAKLSLRIIPLERIAPQQLQQGDLSPEAADKIRAALAPICEMVPAPAAK